MTTVLLEPAKEQSRSEIAMQRSVADRWTASLTQGGWTPVSDFFLDHYHELPHPLSSSEALVVIHLIRHKWTRDAPFPSLKRIGGKMGITATAVRNHVRSLEQKGYVQRVPKAGFANAFDLQPLFNALERLQPQVVGNARG
jgi:hypothetical protein